MAEIMTLEPTATESAELQAQINHYLTEMRRLNEQMAHDQELIDSLRAESQVIATETRGLMKSLQGTLAEMSAV